MMVGVTHESSASATGHSNNIRMVYDRENTQFLVSSTRRSYNLENDRLTLISYVEEKAILQTCTKFDDYCGRASACT